MEQRVISRQEITIMKISPLGQLNQLSLNGIAILLQARLDYEKKYAVGKKIEESWHGMVWGVV